MSENAQVTVRWLADGQVQTAGPERLEEARATGLVWVDVLGIEEAPLRELEKTFDLHPLAVEDVFHSPQRPKINQYGSTWVLVWLTPEKEDSDGITMAEVDFFLGPDFLITVRDGPLKAFEDALAEGPSIFARKVAGLFHEIVDRLVDSTLPLVDDVGDRLEDIEDVMLDSPRKDDLEKLYHLRRELVVLHRMIGPERDVLRTLVRLPDIVDDDVYRYLQDVGDHLARAEDSIETAREVAAAIMDIYLSSQSNRMNAIMKQLTVVATIFMPLTLISGIYGMNILGRPGHPGGMWPPVEAWWSFWLVVVGMLVIAVVMAAYFRRKNWW